MSAGPGIVVVGAGECGARAVFELRSAGWDGPITLVGAEDALPYERPPLSKAVLTGAAEPAPVCDAATLRDTRVEFVRGVAAVDIDRESHELVLADGRRITYERMLLATGAAPRRLPWVGGGHYLRCLADVLTLRERLRPGARIGVIGGGFIGLELAASATARGCAVTVVEIAPRLLARAVPAEVAAVVSAAAIGPGNTVAKDIRLAEMLIAAQAAPAAAALTNPAMPLKALLRAHNAR